MDMKRILLCGGMVMLLANAAMAEPAGMGMYFQSGDEVYLLPSTRAAKGDGAVLVVVHAKARPSPRRPHIKAQKNRAVILQPPTCCIKSKTKPR